MLTPTLATHTQGNGEQATLREEAPATHPPLDALLPCSHILVQGYTCASEAAAEPVTVQLSVSGMMCNHCTSTVEKALRAVEGVDDVTVDLEEGGRAVVRGTASVDALIEAVAPTGHVATDRERWMLVSEDEGGEIDVVRTAET